MLFFRSEELIADWCRARGLKPGPPVRIDQLWEMAVIWYGHRLEADSQRPPAGEIKGLFARIGLVEPFWDPFANA